ncbi:hypothetical protein MBM_04748 [Drepanopeziza brunnea f. sp. 'multigermtubi' MB_m1]|uniref:Uncharacterized protein n=1 Tax=Marssonina brunnea f. sp. multigermtubi (strain MB_m1) TaxID=1072389 RepID=K1WW02_MARBU|nr:uncharacterized protein MBM_04748 [Drepanopeziza brunnea f. sp. 'multigermtubi' MB_m1]EKD17171.1 hypothetical protein MBM_04748 [Drepanopeziza brunnea f. sp. 'multigermtubi' MB_m1]
MAEGRCLFQAASGYMRLGPDYLRTGDLVCAILGCDTLILLRQHSLESEEHEFVGASYIDEYSEGEEILGPLPEGTSCHDEFETEKKRFRRVCVSEGTRSTEDSRPGPLPPSWRLKARPTEHSHGVYENMATNLPSNEGGGEAGLEEIERS